MADEPFDWSKYLPPVTQPRPVEQLFEFQKSSRLISCELRYHGEYGVEAQFIEDGELFYSRRFDTRAQAVEWAEIERHEQQRSV